MVINNLIIESGVLVGHEISSETVSNSVVIPKGTTDIGECVFQGTGNIIAVTIPDGVASIGSCAFQS